MALLITILITPPVKSSIQLSQPVSVAIHKEIHFKYSPVIPTTAVRKEMASRPERKYSPPYDPMAVLRKYSPSSDLMMVLRKYSPSSDPMTVQRRNIAHPLIS